MITNLFSIFDPSSSIIGTAWLSIILPIVIIIKFKFFYNKKYLIINKINREIKALIRNTPKRINSLIKTVFLFILILNFLALFPFVFTPTAHISVSFTLALLIWWIIIIFAWRFITKHIIIHTIPIGTPLILINFIFTIEIVSNIIRPITLSVRLTANIVAGHLLISLLRNFALISINNIIVSSVFILILTILEIAVAFIQAYVFTTLVSLYIRETL